ncbi:MAG: quinone oxidoreductase [Alphaproteobacteria bacterium]|jgi:NADPH2:quinone reductase|nr:quinone oxidoreductase [Rhodospirillaceae bacterium]MDP6031532.1 quinone oxidoreductase [Alphaproteobacteria bacterium]MDP7183384.1 quinone oxidoreductase [Alphaproteobacteria bacterium]MDP7190589.1 quinone oxidoreductase [Alphaproteobacteria bacterium]HJO88585.1 quinone oxidoreductase [Alphaproteobacteria bacterium]|tara:strand:- start:3384 stop:4358 length:975 start_codon:yes stop_codon:yes gene_type:complete
MSKAVRIHETGGPEVLKWEDVETEGPGSGEALVRHTAVGLNYIDVYHRSGLYPLPALPAVIGMEGAGIVEAVSEGVEKVAVGDRVAYAAPPPGAYAEKRLISADRLVAVPEGIDDVTAAAMMLKGMTAQYLLRCTHPVKSGETILVHAAAGGVGMILCQWASHLGVRVIGTVGSEAKVEHAKTHGCDYALLYDDGGYVNEIEVITEGRGVDVVYDGVGSETFDSSLESLSMLGHLVSFGQTSGPVEPVELGLLSAKSATLTRPVLFHYTESRGDLVAAANELFDVVGRGVVRIEVSGTCPLADAAEAHRDLESRLTTGSTVLIP